MTNNKGMAGGTTDVQNNLEEDEIDPCPMQYGYRFSIWRSLIMYPLAALPACTGFLFAYWFPHIWVRLTCSRSELVSSQLVLVKDLNSKWRVEFVRKFHNSLPLETDDEDDNINSKYTESTRLLASTTPFFIHRHLRYIYNYDRKKFIVLRGYEEDTPCSALHSMRCGLHGDELDNRRSLYGSNLIDVPVKPYHVLLIEEVLHPFYIFQILSVIFWVVDEYYIYSGAILLIFIISVTISLVQTRRYMKQLHDMVITTNQVTVMRNGRLYGDVSSETLVPGDVLVVPHEGLVMSCDAALLTGSVIVNEAMLTGESVPITKTPLPMESRAYHADSHKRHTLFAGSQVLQAQSYSQGRVLAVVVRTGFLTTKGNMVRYILFPKPLNIKFYMDSIKFVLLLSILAGCGFIYTFLILQLHQPRYQIKETILRAFDIITTVVPPSLPTAITVGTIYALNRLKKNKIYCISPQRVNLCGKVKLVCFDKTGTLTEDSLDMMGVQPVYNNKFGELLTDPSQLPLSSPFLYGMATCHSLTHINEELTGDPLDLKMFQSTNWVLEEPSSDAASPVMLQMKIARPCSFDGPSSIPADGLLLDDASDSIFNDNSTQLGILKQFTFSSELQRMSVLALKLPSEQSRSMYIFVKGAPETIRKLSRPETVPSEFGQVLSSLTKNGYRVLAMGYRNLHMAWHKAERLERDEVEHDLIFGGLIVYENKLKLQTTPVLRELQSASIRTVMITGDNLLTAIAISKSCGMVGGDHHVIIVKATPTSDNIPPRLSYFLFDSDKSDLSRLTSSGGFSGHYQTLNSNNEIGIQIEGKAFTEMSHNSLYAKEYFHLALDGVTYSIICDYYPELLPKVLVSGTVFARMSPFHKKQLVTNFMDLGYGVAMCGDGANDCGALKAAHVGISLSETEASVASPFTSKIPNISCVPIAIKEGRAALVTSFGIFKFMALYSLTEFTSVAMLYAIESNLGDFHYLYIDLVLILAFAFVMGLTGPYPRLVKRRPLGTLAGVRVFASVLTQLFLMASVQLSVFFYLRTEYWFTPLVPDQETDNISCFETTAVFCVSIFQYVSLAIAFSTAAPYRRPLYTNILFMLCLLILLPANLYLALAPPNWLPQLWSYLEMVPGKSFYFRLTVVMIAAIHFLIANFIEKFIFPTSFMISLLRLVRCKFSPKNRYKHILKSIENDTQWPPPLPHGSASHC